MYATFKVKKKNSTPLSKSESLSSVPKHNGQAGDFLWRCLYLVVCQQSWNVGLRVEGPLEATHHLLAMPWFHSRGPASRRNACIPTLCSVRLFCHLDSCTCLLFQNSFLKEEWVIFLKFKLLRVTCLFKTLSGFLFTLLPLLNCLYVKANLLKMF